MFGLSGFRVHGGRGGEPLGLYVEGQGDLVSGLVTPITHIVTLVIPISNLLTKPPCSPSTLSETSKSRDPRGSHLSCLKIWGAKPYTLTPPLQDKPPKTNSYEDGFPLMGFVV